MFENVVSEKKLGTFTGLFTHEENTEEIDSKEQQSLSASSPSSSNFLLGKNWRDLIPVVKVSGISSFIHLTFYCLKVCHCFIK